MGCAASGPVDGHDAIESDKKLHDVTGVDSKSGASLASTEMSNSNASNASAAASTSSPAAASVSSPAKGSTSPKPTSPKGVPAAKPLQQRYTLGKVLGKGGFGEVREAIRKEDGKRVAVKTISKLKFAGEEEHQNMLTEVALHQRVSVENGHPNVVSLYEWCEDKGSFYMVIEVCTGGELMDRIVKEQHFSEKIASRYFKQMCEGLAHIHSKLVVHRDLKPENFLMESTSPDACIKISDFGLSCAIASPDGVITDACGSAYYIAPEVFTKKYGKGADVWALGVILYLLISGTVPFGATATSEIDVYKAIQREKLHFGPEWNTTTGAVRELVSGLLEKDPTKRYTIEQALAHPWVRGEAASDAPFDKSLITSMLSFNARNKFKKGALRMVASALGAADVSTLRAAFHKIDIDNTGFITYNEMAQALAEMGVRAEKEQIGELMRNMDADGDGRISYDEFLTAVVERQLVHQQNAIWWAFCEYDIDGDGKITAAELTRIMKHESPATIAKYIEEFDIDHDGTISYEEFMRMLLPKDLKFKITAY